MSTKQCLTNPIGSANTDPLLSGSAVGVSASDRRWARAVMPTSTRWRRVFSRRSNARVSRHIASHRTRTHAVLTVSPDKYEPCP